MSVGTPAPPHGPLPGLQAPLAKPELLGGRPTPATGSPGLAFTGLKHPLCLTGQFATKQAGPFRALLAELASEGGFGPARVRTCQDSPEAVAVQRVLGKELCFLRLGSRCCSLGHQTPLEERQAAYGRWHQPFSG